MQKCKKQGTILLQDLVLWFKQHNLLLQGPEGSVHEVYNAVLANITEEEAASQTVPG